MKHLSVMFLLSVMTLSSFATAGDPDAGKARSASCAGCHGAYGISNSPMFPNLAGQKELYLVSALKQYRDGVRNNPMMSGMAKGLSDADIANIASYYTNLKQDWL